VPGWTIARLRNHESLGRTHLILDGSTPRSSSHWHASVEVLPAPMIA